MGTTAGAVTPAVAYTLKEGFTRRWAVLLAFVLMALTALTGAADGGLDYRADVQPGASGGPSGMATFTLTPGGMYKMRLVVTGLERNSSHVFHIHKGSCAAQRGIVKDLGVLTANNGGIAIVTRWLGVEELQGLVANHAYVNIHAGARLPSPGITCGDILAVEA